VVDLADLGRQVVGGRTPEGNDQRDERGGDGDDGDDGEEVEAVGLLPLVDVVDDRLGGRLPLADAGDLGRSLGDLRPVLRRGGGGGGSDGGGRVALGRHDFFSLAMPVHQSVTRNIRAPECGNLQYCLFRQHYRFPHFELPSSNLLPYTKILFIYSSFWLLLAIYALWHRLLTIIKQFFFLAFK